MMPDRDWSSESGYRFDFNGKETDNESGLQNYGERIYNKTLGKFLSVDPFTKKYVYLTPYQFASNSPISGVDLDGLEFFYAADGTFLGRTGTSQEVRVLNNTDVSNEVAIQGIKNFNAGKPELTEDVWATKIVNDTESLGINHDEFIKSSSVAYGESSIGYGIVSYEEMNSIANIYVHGRNQIAYALNKSEAIRFRGKSEAERNADEGMRIAVSATVGALTGIDYSNGADAWDGMEQALFGGSDNRFRVPEKGWLLHMNTNGWTISDEHYASWKAAVGKNFRAPQEKYAPGNYKGYKNENTITLKSTAQYGRSIFWQTLKGEDVIKKPDTIK